MIARSRWRRGPIVAFCAAGAVLAVLCTLVVVRTSPHGAGTAGHVPRPPRAAALLAPPTAVPGAAVAPGVRPVRAPGGGAPPVPGAGRAPVSANAPGRAQRSGPGVPPVPGAAPGARAGTGDGRLAAGASGSRREQWMFGLALPGSRPGEVMFAPARKEQPGGPETARAAAPGRYAPLALAPGAEVWLTAPLADPEPTDYVKGVRIAPDRFGDLYRTAQERLGGTMADRAHMFELWLDGQGRILRMRHYFSP